MVVKTLGRERANRLSAPVYDWLARQETERRLRALPRQDLNVNLGCGDRPLAGWINLDRARGPQVDIVWDLRRGLPFPSESCSAIFAEHVIEHLAKSDAENLLKECYRVLQPRGVLRLSTPDAGRYLCSYAGDRNFLYHRNFTRAISTPLDRINVMMREDGQHLWVYDAESLIMVLNRAGFSKVFEQPFGISVHPKMSDIDYPQRAFESLCVEAAK